MEKPQIKYFSIIDIVVRYFVVVGCVSSAINTLFGPLSGSLYFILFFLFFIDQDFEDPEIPNEIDKIGSHLNLHRC
jgi:hypothetical protein